MSTMCDTCLPTSADLALARARSAARLDLPTLLAFAALVVLIGGNTVAVRLVSRQLPLFWGAGTRFAIAGFIFAGIVAVRRLPLPRGRVLAAALAFGMLQFGLGLALGYWAMQRVPAGLTSLILALVPLFTLLTAAAARQERLSVRGLIGALIAVAGIGLLFGTRSGQVPPLRLLAAVGMALSIGLTGVLLRAYPQVPGASMNAVGMLVGSAILLVMSVVTGETSGGLALLPAEPTIWWAQAYLILPGSVGVFALFLHLLRRWKASTVSYQTVLSPVVTILLSVWLLSESLTSNLALGGALILLGVYVGALAHERRNAA
jgi:drug/metabolite transporter (DMT)-like permease